MAKKEDKKEKKEKKEEEKEEKKEKKEDKEKEEEEKEEKEEVEVPEKFEDIVKTIEEMSVLDLSELVDILEEKFGVSTSAPVAAAPANGGNGGGEEEEEKSAYDVEIQEIGDKKIDVIKAVRDITGKGLKDAKNLVDSIQDEPQVISKSVPTDEAKEMKEKIEEAGATVELK